MDNDSEVFVNAKYRKSTILTNFNFVRYHIIKNEIALYSSEVGGNDDENWYFLRLRPFDNYREKYGHTDLLINCRDVNEMNDFLKKLDEFFSE